jgi:hypothetical protein
MTSPIEFQLEDALPELEEQVRHGVWSASEVRHIVSERRRHEHGIARSGATRDDYLKLISFEVNLDQLCQERIARLGVTTTSLVTFNSHSLTLLSGLKQKSFLLARAGKARVQSTFERLVARLGNADASLWLEYAEYCRSVFHYEKMERLFARALRMHPTCDALWILSAKHEFEINASVDAARVLLQRGLRLNAQSRKLWLELFRLELLYVDKVRARQAVLGIDNDATDLPPEEDDEEDDDNNNDDDELIGPAPRRGIYDSDSDESDDDASGSDKFYDRITRAREKRSKRKKALAAAKEPSARARAVARRAFLDGALAGVVARRAQAVFPRDFRLRVELIRIAMLFPFVHAFVDEQVALFEADFGADADAVSALAELLCSTIRVSATVVADLPPAPWRSWRECVELFERAVQRAKASDDEAADTAPIFWPSSAMRTALLRFVLARVAEGVVELSPQEIFSRLANDEPLFGAIRKIPRRKATSDQGDADADDAAQMQIGDAVRLSADGYALLAHALLRSGKLTAAVAVLQQLVGSPAFAAVDEDQRNELTRLLAASNASAARVELGAAASYAAGAQTFRATTPMSLGLVAKEFLAILDGALDVDDGDDDDDDDDVPASLERALIFYEEVMTSCPRDLEAIGRFQVACLNGVAARLSFAAVQHFFDAASRFPPLTSAMRQRYVGCVVTYGKLSPSHAMTTRRAFEQAVQAEPRNEALWRRWLRYETDSGDLSRCGEIQWRMIAAMQDE